VEVVRGTSDFEVICANLKDKAKVSYVIRGTYTEQPRSATPSRHENERYTNKHPHKKTVRKLGNVPRPNTSDAFAVLRSLDIKFVNNFYKDNENSNMLDFSLY
jgi:hypothetical protein